MQAINDGELLNISNQFYSAMKGLENHKDWKLKEEKPVTFYQMELNGRLCIKAWIDLNIPYEKVVKFFSDPQLFKQLNDNFKKFDVVLEKNVEGKILRVIHSIIAMPGPISNRELVAVNTVRMQGDRGYLGNRSCGYPVKNDPDAVRAEAQAAGFIAEKLDAGRTRVINISDLDVKGSIPGFVKSAMSGKRIEVMKSLEQKINSLVK